MGTCPNFQIDCLMANKRRDIDIYYSLHPKLLDTFNKSLCSKLDDLFLSYPNLDFFGNLTVQMERNTAN
jgi:hypothetical protein